MDRREFLGSTGIAGSVSSAALFSGCAFDPETGAAVFSLVSEEPDVEFCSEAGLVALPGQVNARLGPDHVAQADASQICLQQVQQGEQVECARRRRIERGYLS